MNESKDMLAINLASALRDVFKYWYILIISVFLMLVFAFTYLKYTTKTYSVKASIVLRTEKNRSIGGQDDILSAFDFMVQDKTFVNEIFYLQSLPLIEEVIAQMELRTYYFIQDARIPKYLNFGIQNIYKNSPIIVVPDDGNSQPVNLLFQIKILDEKKFFISAEGENVELIDFRSDRNAGRASRYEISGEYEFGATVRNEYSSFRVLLNSNYSPWYYADKRIYFQFNHLGQLARQFKWSFKAEEHGMQSTLVNLNVRADNTALGLDFLNKLIHTYIERNFEEANLLANKTIEHIEAQLGDISEDLTLSERQLQNLRINRNVMNIDEKSGNIYNQLQTFETRRVEVQRRLNHLRQMDDYFKQYKDSTRILAPSALGLNDPMLNGLINELTSLNSEKQRIISQDQMRNPRLATLNIRIENLKDVISENLNFSLSTTRSELEELNSRIGSLNREFAILPDTQRELLDIERRFKLNDAIYTSLLERRIQAMIIKASKLPDAKIIEPPASAGVAKPKGVIIIAMSFFIGLLLPSGFIMGKKLILNRLSNKEEIQLFTRFPTAASIPTSETNRKSILSYPKSAMAESFYMLRSNLVYYLHGEKNKVILLTSSLPGEGKSFSAYNLAASFALSNNKTVLVEFDLRKPSDVMFGFNTHNMPGASSYLINKASLQDIIIKTQNPYLDIIQSGNIPPNPIALLSGNKTRELIEELQKQYDYVIIDTPPYGLLTDSFLLMNHADLTLFVTRINFTKKSLLAMNLDDLEKKRINNLFILVNEDKNEMQSYGYEKYYLKKEKSKKTVSSKK